MFITWMLAVAVGVPPGSVGVLLVPDGPSLPPQDEKRGAERTRRTGTTGGTRNMGASGCFVLELRGCL